MRGVHDQSGIRCRDREWRLFDSGTMSRAATNATNETATAGEVQEGLGRVLSRGGVPRSLVDPLETELRTRQTEINKFDIARRVLIPLKERRDAATAVFPTQHHSLERADGRRSSTVVGRADPSSTS